MRTAVYTTLFAFIARGLAGGETITVSDLSIHKRGTPAGLQIESVSFKVNGIDADNLDCSATSVAFPEPDDLIPCGETHYFFTLWAGEKEEFRVMVYHDVGDSHADYRGWSDVPTVCKDNSATGPLDQTCTQDKPLTWQIDGPVGLRPDL